MANGNHIKHAGRTGSLRRFGEPRWRRFLSSPLVIAVLLAILVFTAHAAWVIYEKDRLSAGRLVQAQANLKRLQDQQSSLNDRIKFLSTDRGIEAELREKYRAVKDGESVAVIVDASDTSTSTPAAAAQAGWFRSFLQIFGL